MGSNYERAAREFIETEILVHMDHMIVEDMREEEGMQGGPAWRKVLKDLRLLGFDMGGKDG